MWEWSRGEEKRKKIEMLEAVADKKKKRNREWREEGGGGKLEGEL